MCTYNLTCTYIYIRSNTVEGWITLLITTPVNCQQQEPASFNRRSPNPKWRLTHINHTSSSMVKILKGQLYTHFTY